MSSSADEEDIRNAIMAIRRNRVALKGELRGRIGALCRNGGAVHNSFHLGADACPWGSMALTSGLFWLERILVLGEWTEASGSPCVL